MLQILWNWSCCLGLPLISADLCLFPAILPDLTPLHLGIPMYTLIVDHFSPSTVDGHLLSVSQTISICITALLATSGTDLFLRFAFAVVSCMTVHRCVLFVGKIKYFAFYNSFYCIIIIKYRPVIFKRKMTFIYKK